MWQASRFYRGKTVLVTGHTGFKGSWLAAWLQRLGAQVVGYSLVPEAGPMGHYEAAQVGAGMVSILGDVRDGDHLRAVFRAYAPELVFHLAAQALVLRSYQDPVETYDTNVMGTVHVLEAVRHAPSVRAVVAVTSDKCYENAGGRRMREDDPMGGADPYSSSKGCAELVVSAYSRSFFGDGRRCAIASARAGNVIGGGDWSDYRIIPDLIRALLAGEPGRLRNPGAVRPWQHVLEPLQGYLLLGERLWEEPALAAGGWNFGPPEEVAAPVRDLAALVLACWGGGELAITESEAPPHEEGMLLLDAGKARSGLDWEPQLTLEEAVALTVDWYRGCASDPARAPELTRAQIDGYMARLTARRLVRR